MTDLATKPGAEDEVPRPGDATLTAAPPAPPTDQGAPSVWAPAVSRARKRHLALWIGVPVGAVVLGLAAASTILIAPGTAVAGVPVGGLTAGAAADAIEKRLAETTVTLTLPEGDVTVSGAELGAGVDARQLANDAYAHHPMWDITGWFAAPDPATVTFDATVADAALRAAAPAMYTEPVSATVVLDETSSAYVTTPAVLGTGIDLAPVQAALQGAFSAGERNASLDATTADLPALTPTYVAEARADQLNAMLATAGFYVGAERTVPLDRAVVASWLTLATDDRGVIEVTADSAAIQTVVDSLAAAVNREIVNATVITNSAGKVLRTITAGVTGRTLDSTGGIAQEYAAQLAQGEAAYALPVTETAFKTNALYRHIEVNLSSQRAYLFENGAVVGSYAISSGKSGTNTPTGNFSVFSHVRMQDMGCFEGATYCTENVPWVTYFAPDIAFHGAYWHNNFGTPMSHGCVNMPVATAKFVYDWTPTGTEVSVHY